MRKKLPLDVHPKLLEAFRAAPTNIRAAAEAAGVSYPTAAKALREGLQGHPPIEETLAKTSTKARVLLKSESLAAERLDAPERAIDDAAQQLADEVRIVRSVSAAVIDLQRLGRVMTAYASRMIKVMLDNEHDVVSPAEAQKRAALALDYSAKVIALGRQAVEMERVRLGDPTLVVGLKPVQPDEPADLASAWAEIEKAQRVRRFVPTLIEEKTDAVVPDAIDATA